jgi:hypothetical protein
MSHHGDQLSRQAKAPLPITLGGDVPLEPACAQPSSGRQPRQRPHFPSQTKASDPQPQKMIPNGRKLN